MNKGVGTTIQKNHSSAVVAKFYMSMFLFIAVSVAVVAEVSSASTISCTTDDIMDFFGGIDHEDYIQWATTTNGGCKRYENYMYLPTTTDTSVGSAIHWKVDESNSMLYLAVIVQIDTPDRWVGFGLSELGGMFGTDLALYESSKPKLIQDGYIQDDRQPYIDTKPSSSTSTSESCELDSTDSDGIQNWNYVNVTSTDTFLIVEMSRILDTGDSYDHPIINDRTVEVPVQRIVVAWGSTSTVSYHSTNKVRGAIRWFSSKTTTGTTSTSKDIDFHTKMLQKADGYIDFFAPNYTIPSVETTYAGFCFFYEDFGLPESTYLIGYDAIINGDVGRTHIHHYVLSASRVPQSEAAPGCFDYLPNSEVIWPWAPGEPGFDFPDYLSVSAGPKSSSKLITFQLQIHYDNPNGLTGLVDNSGVRLYYSSKARTHEAGFLLLGDPNVNLSNRKVGTGITEHAFSCPNTCSKFALNDGNNQNSVTVVREHLHMHQTGSAIRNDLIRGVNGDIVHTGRIDYWDFKQQGDPAPVQAPFQIQPGDAFKLTCYYNNKDDSTKFGLGTREEMCMAFLMYYPRIQIEDPWVCGFYSAYTNECRSSYLYNEITEKSNIPRSFGTTQCKSVEQPPTTNRRSCPETYRCTGRLAITAKYSITRKNVFQRCVSRCVSANMIPMWKILGYQCGDCP